MVIDITLTCKTVSEANSTEHWRVKHMRHRKQKLLALCALSKQPTMTLPCHVKLTRIAPRFLDAKDNLPMALKWIADQIADWLVPGLAAGRADDDERITWEYDQKKGSPQAVRIEITSTES